MAGLNQSYILDKKRRMQTKVETKIFQSGAHGFEIRLCKFNSGSEVFIIGMQVSRRMN